MTEDFVPSTSLDSRTIPMDVEIPLIDPSSNPETFSNNTIAKSVITNLNRPDSSSIVEKRLNNHNSPSDQLIVQSSNTEPKELATTEKLFSVAELKTAPFYQALFSEFIGTMLLTLVATSTGLPITKKSVPPLHGSLASGFVVTAIIVGFGDISGAHINPAVTITFLVAREIGVIRAVFYIVMQILGAIAGSSIVFLLAPPHAQRNLGMTMITEDVSCFQALVVEFFITFMLCYVVHAICDKQRDDIGGSKAVIVGLVVTIGCLFGGPYTGGSMNPARSFGPALIMDSWENHWIYWVGPIFGSIVAALIYTRVLKKSPTPPNIGRRDSQLRSNIDRSNHI